ncbi:unnamed protein product [Camellia sinensis]
MITVENLRRKLEMNKKRKKAKSIDFETVKEQLQEVAETIVQLVEVNGQLSQNIEQSPLHLDGNASPELEEAGDVQRKRVLEQARKGSEKIRWLQLEVPKIHYVLLKLLDEKKNNEKSRFSRSKTTTILRDFIHSGRSSPRRKKAGLFGCFRLPTNGDEGVNRGFATLLAGTLGVGAHRIASFSGEICEPILLGLFVFILAAVVTFIRFFPRMKARYDYGLLIFILTFCLISVSGYRDDEVLEMAHRRLSTILIGGASAVIVCVCICRGKFPSFIALDVGSILPRYASPDLSGDCVGRSGKFLGYSLLTQNGQQNALVIFVRGVALDLQWVNRFQSKEGRGREDSDAHLVSRILGRPWYFQSNNTSQSKGQLCVVCLEDFGAEHKQVMELPCPINSTQNVSSRGSLLI